MNKRQFILNFGSTMLALPVVLQQVASAQEPNDQGGWVDVSPLVRVKSLWLANDVNKARANLVQLKPGFIFSHTHMGYEITYVLDGILIANDISYTAGQMMYMEPQSCHTGTVGPHGTTVLVLETLTKTNVSQCSVD